MIQRAVAKVHERLRGQSGEAFDKVMPLFELLTGTSAQAQDACDRIDRIVKNLRLFAQLDSDEFQRVQIHAGIESTLRLLRHEFGERIEVSTEFGDVPEIHCSPRELNQLFMNLLLNATESMEESGHGQIRIRTWTDGDRVNVEIADNGRGIPDEDIDKIFDPGFTTKGVKVGTGLGLPICYQIVQAHQGAIDVSNRAGEGTRFTVSLPVRLRV